MKVRAISLGLAVVIMGAAALAAEVLKPRTLMARTQTDLSIAKALPKSFGGWQEVPGVRLVEPPGSDTLEREIYNQEVARAYRDSEGHVVMFLIAYGESQSDRLQLHRPEVCYAAQGFFVKRPVDAAFAYRINEPPLAIRRLMTRREDRVEPITYWMRIGYDVSEGVLERQRLKLEYGLRGLIPDGALFRVSTIGVSEELGYKLQAKFMHDLFEAVDPSFLSFMVGDPTRAYIPRVAG